MNSIHVNKIIAMGCHGCLDFEKKQAQQFEVELFLNLDLSKPGQSDNLSDTIDYGKIEAITIRTIKLNSFNLIEKLATQILFELFSEFHNIESIQIELFKPNAPMPFGSFPSICLNMHRTEFEEVPVYLSLGSNLSSEIGSSKDLVTLAINRISALPSTKILKQSSFYSTKPIEAIGPDYINNAIKISTRLTPEELLSYLQKIEDMFQRDRVSFHSPRTLDIDIIHYGAISRTKTLLTLPHPRWSERAFVLIPLNEIGCPYINQEMLENVSSQSVDKISE